MRATSASPPGVTSRTVRRDMHEIRAVTREVAGADDARVMRIVATVDAMSARGPADELIVPVRHRLAALRPPRPLRFARLLFYPLDPLIVCPGVLAARPARDPADRAGAAGRLRPGRDGDPRHAPSRRRSAAGPRRTPI